MNILLGVTGSVAAVLAPKLIRELQTIGDVRVVVTDTVQHFTSIDDLPFGVKVYNDRSEWTGFNGVGDPILHIELRKWADIMLIAPCTMNTLGKIANGLCDNLLTNTVRAWNFEKPIILAPACNTYMWDNPITDHQITVFEMMGGVIVRPISKTLACGDTGVGAMANIADIISEVKSHKKEVM